MTLQSVAEKMNIGSYQTLSSVERGTRSLRASELTQLCRIYHRNVDFFLSEDEPVEVPAVFAWRSKSDEADPSVLEAEVLHLLNNYHMLEQLSDEPECDDLKVWDSDDEPLTIESVQKKAGEILEALDLSHCPGNDLVSALEKKMNVKIINYDLGGHGSAMCTYGGFGYAIAVERTHAPWRRSFSIAHELFHLLSRDIFPLAKVHKSGSGTKPIEEVLADAFAASLLLSEDALLNSVEKHVKEGKIAFRDLEYVAFDLGVSTAALLWRLVNLKRIAKDDVQSYLTSPQHQHASKNIRRGANTYAPKFSNRFVLLGLKALDEGKISKGKFCEIFGISRHEFSDFIAERGDFEGTVDDSEIELNYT
ncbi:MAG: ImmA/IrrE family metallo-endopeptidase [candidate division Zixibacteria bacterium]|nr:ImmA/IrrE family metallo-endopeptidase [candidate division Zixibacteria bacterium]